MTTLQVRVPYTFALWAPTVGYVLGAEMLLYRQAETLLADRRANGEAFDGEQIVPVVLNLCVDPGGACRGGFLPPGAAEASGTMAGALLPLGETALLPRQQALFKGLRLRAQATGEVRPPQQGEWYCAGGVAARAKQTMTTAYPLARLVWVTAAGLVACIERDGRWESVPGARR